MQSLLWVFFFNIKNKNWVERYFYLVGTKITLKRKINNHFNLEEEIVMSPWDLPGYINKLINCAALHGVIVCLCMFSLC